MQDADGPVFAEYFEQACAITNIASLKRPPAHGPSVADAQVIIRDGDYPAAASALQAWLPIYPAPPVTITAPFGAKGAGSALFKAVSGTGAALAGRSLFMAYANLSLLVIKMDLSVQL